MIMPQGQGFLPTSRPSTTSGRLDHPWVHRVWARTSRMIADHSKHLEASRHIFSLQCNQNRHQALKPMQTYFLQGYLSVSSTPIELVELSGIEPLTPCLQSRC